MSEQSSERYIIFRVKTLILVKVNIQRRVINAKIANKLQ